MARGKTSAFLSTPITQRAEWANLSEAIPRDTHPHMLMAGTRRCVPVSWPSSHLSESPQTAHTLAVSYSFVAGYLSTHLIGRTYYCQLVCPQMSKLKSIGRKPFSNQVFQISSGTRDFHLFLVPWIVLHGGEDEMYIGFLPQAFFILSF